MTSSARDCWYLSGPTASGKTAVGVALAQMIGAEIVSLDSMAIYRGMNIGTAKPTLEQRSSIRHHLIDIRGPDEEYSLANYVEDAVECVQDITARGKTALFVGGTPLYLKALLRGIFRGPPADWEFRRQVEAEVAVVGVTALHERLRQVDPLSAAKLAPGDVRRIVRALEVYKKTGQPISHLQMQFDEARPPWQCTVFVLQWPRPLLHERINQRVEQMFAKGLLEEVRGLQQLYRLLSRTASQAVGYREVIEYLDRQQNFDATVQRVKVRTRRFAKRQLTWFRSLSECRHIDRFPDVDATAVAREIFEQGVRRLNDRG